MNTLQNYGNQMVRYGTDDGVDKEWVIRMGRCRGYEQP